MSIRDYSRKLCIKGSAESTPSVVRCNEKLVTLTLPLYQVNLIDSIIECLENESGCEVWYAYMKDQ